MFDIEDRVWDWVEPPQAVVIHLARVFPPRRLDWGRSTPLWARAQGLRLEPTPAKLHLWITTATGDRLAGCTLVIQAGGRELPLHQLVPENAVQLR